MKLTELRRALPTMKAITGEDALFIFTKADHVPVAELYYTERGPELLLYRGKRLIRFADAFLTKAKFALRLKADGVDTSNEKKVRAAWLKRNRECFEELCAILAAHIKGELEPHGQQFPNYFNSVGLRAFGYVPTDTPDAKTPVSRAKPLPKPKANEGSAPVVKTPVRGRKAAEWTPEDEAALQMQLDELAKLTASIGVQHKRRSKAFIAEAKKRPDPDTRPTAAKTKLVKKNEPITTPTKARSKK